MDTTYITTTLIHELESQQQEMFVEIFELGVDRIDWLDLEARVLKFHELNIQIEGIKALASRLQHAAKQEG